MKFTSYIPVLFAAVLAVAACGKKEAPPPAAAPVAVAPAPDLVNVAVAVRQVVLANQIGADKKAVAPATTFAPADTLYAVVDTVGSGKASVKALWTFHKGDQVVQVNETVQELVLAGPATSEFHVSKPGGWPVGDYQVEVFLNGTSAGAQKFAVK